MNFHVDLIFASLCKKYIGVYVPQVKIALQIALNVSKYVEVASTHGEVNTLNAWGWQVYICIHGY